MKRFNDLKEQKMKGEDPCWKGYEMVGTKKKNGKEVPNCVPTTEENHNVSEETDTLEKNEMAQTQLHFIKYAAEEILEYIEMGGEIEEWYQNKLSKVQSEVESLHSYVEGESRRTGMKEDVVSEQDDKFSRYMPEQKPPFDGPYTKTKGTVTDKSGAKHSPMSRARDLARDAMKKTMLAPKKKSVSESRQASIVREAAKDAKEKAKTKDDKKTGTKDKFEAEPELTSQIVTTNNQ